MATPNVLRLAQAADNTSFVLVHVSSTGSRPLDLRLVGTENEFVFAAQLKQNQTSSLKTTSCPCDQDGWDAILRHVLLGASVEEQELLKGVEAIAKVEKKNLTINIQKRIEGITQKLGSISLPREDKATDDVDLYEWCGAAVNQANAYNGELEKLKREVNEQNDRVNKLNQSLEELVKAKMEYEQELLEKFSLLLNEKKLKIRDQQRLLAGSRVDPRKLEAVEASRSTSKPRSAGTSRAGKRKAGRNTKGDSENDEDGFDKMDVDDGAASKLSDQEDAQTPSGESTAEDTDEDIALPDRTSKAAMSKGRGTGTTSQTPASSNTEPGMDDVPPKRELPFAGKATDSAPAAKTAQAEGSETESDDEL